MQEGHAPGETAEDRRMDGAEGDTRPQKGGEAATTRFGMEESDESEVPATGGVGEEAPDRSA